MRVGRSLAPLLRLRRVAAPSTDRRAAQVANLSFSVRARFDLGAPRAGPHRRLSSRPRGTRSDCTTFLVAVPAGGLDFLRTRTPDAEIFISAEELDEATADGDATDQLRTSTHGRLRRAPLASRCARSGWRDLGSLRAALGAPMSDALIELAKQRTRVRANLARWTSLISSRALLVMANPPSARLALSRVTQLTARTNRSLPLPKPTATLAVCAGGPRDSSSVATPHGPGRSLPTADWLQSHRPPWGVDVLAHFEALRMFIHGFRGHWPGRMTAARGGSPAQAEQGASPTCKLALKTSCRLSIPSDRCPQWNRCCARTPGVGLALIVARVGESRWRAAGGRRQRMRVSRCANASGFEVTRFDCPTQHSTTGSNWRTYKCRAWRTGSWSNCPPAAMASAGAEES